MNSAHPLASGNAFTSAPYIMLNVKPYEEQILTLKTNIIIYFRDEKTKQQNVIAGVLHNS